MIRPFDRLGDILVKMGDIDRNTLEEFQYQSQMKVIGGLEPRVSIEKLVSEDRRNYFTSYKSSILGKRLVSANLITEEQLDRALSIKSIMETSFPNVSKDDFVIISEILQKISRSINIFCVLNLIMEYCNKVIHAEASTLFLHNEEKDSLIFDVVTGEEKEFLTNKEISINRGIVGWAFQNNSSCIVNDVRSDRRFDPSFDNASGFKTRNILCVPIRVNFKIEGVLEVINKFDNQPFSEEDEGLLQILANQIGIHMENRILMESLSGKTCQLENAKKELEEFVYKISHDLQEPLFSIRGYMTRLSDANKIDDNVKRYINRVNVNVENMYQRIQDIVDTLKAGWIKYNFKSHDVGDIVNDVVRTLKDKIETNKAKIIIQGNLPEVLCDEKQLKDVFLNLIANAIKFMGDDQERQITIGCEKDDTYYKFFVEDTGIGIKKKFQDQIFEMFKRLEEVEAKGMGIGLMVVKKIVELHKGEIWVESPVKYGKGSRFCFTIPIKSV